MGRVVLDIETDSKHTVIWCAVLNDIDTGEVTCHTNATGLRAALDIAEQVIGHNLVAFDKWHLQNLWGIQIPLTKCYDTLIVSRLMRPDLQGGHSLETWGNRLNFKKSDYPAAYREKFPNDYYPSKEWNEPDMPMLIAYCKQDTRVTARLLKHLEKQLTAQKFVGECIELEHQVAEIIAEQVRNGVLIDQKALTTLYAEVQDEVAKIEKDLVAKFEPTIIQLKTKQKIQPFNPGSRQQIVDRLIKCGWEPTEKTEKGNVILDEEILKHMDIPEAKDFLRYFEVTKIQSFLTNWLDKIGEDGRIHGAVISNGAVTGRMTHSSPNLGQVPSGQTEYGKRCRAVYTVPAGCVMVGIDASGLELRMLAHYMQDQSYVDSVVHGKREDATDVHSVNQKAAGLRTRDQAKTFIYAFLYGAGAEKIGKIVGGSSKDGKVLIDNFLSSTPTLLALRAKVARMATKGSLPGLDGRRLYIRQEHKALNTLLQGAGAIVMKKALIIFKLLLDSRHIPHKFVLNVHDEWQVETPVKYGEEVGQLGVMAIRQAGVALALRCPLDAEYKVGRNWSETH